MTWHPLSGQIELLKADGERIATSFMASGAGKGIQI
jgi:hypothetical protein